MKTNNLPLPNLGLLEIFLLQVVGYGILWLISDYAATLVSVLFPIIFLFLLLLSQVVELVQKSKVPKWYYWFMVVSILAPLFTAFLFTFIMGIDFDWTKI